MSEKPIIYYFGTNVNGIGHNFYALYDHEVYLNKSFFQQVVKEIGFDPETLPKNTSVKGAHEFYHINGYSVLAILGSCSDRRAGSKSIFYVNEIVTEAQIAQAILSTPSAKAIIDAMPFDVSLFTKQDKPCSTDLLSILQEESCKFDSPAYSFMSKEDKTIAKAEFQNGGMFIIHRINSSDLSLLLAAPKLLAACKEFVRKCESGEARSVRSYAQMKVAINEAENYAQQKS